MWSKPITLGEYYDSPPITGKDILPPRSPGIYAACLKKPDPVRGPHEDDEVLYVGTTYRGTGPELLFRVSGLIFDALGFTGEGNKSGSARSYFHSGGREIYLYCQKEKKPLKSIFIFWKAKDQSFCPACEEHSLYQRFKGRPTFLNKQTPPSCPHP
jgi:hypothetical protein